MTAERLVNKIMGQYVDLDPIEFERFLARTLDDALRVAHEGLRDRFAMAALQGLIPSSDSSPEEFAKDAYKIADAMIEARKSVAQEPQKAAS